MNSSAALPFELPSTPASGPGLSEVPDFPKGQCSEDEGSTGTFDDALNARSTAPAAGLTLRAVPDRSPHAPPTDGRPASLIVPAEYQSQFPMPASLVPEAQAEVVEAEDTDAEAVVEAAELQAPVEPAYEWAFAMTVFRPVPQPETPSAKPPVDAETAALPTVVSRELVVSGHRLDASAIGEFPTANTGPSGRRSETTPGVVGRPQQGISPEAETPADPEPPTVPATPANPATPPVAAVPVYRHMPGNRVEVKKPLTDAELRQAVADRIKAGGHHELVAPQAEAVVVASLERPKDTVLPDRLNGSPTSSQPDSVPSRGSVPSEAEVVTAPVRPHQANRPLAAQEVLRALETRLQAEGIAFNGPLQIEILSTPETAAAAPVPVEVETRPAAISGWSEKSGKIVPEQDGQSSFRSGAEADGKNQPGAYAPIVLPQPASGRTSTVETAAWTPDAPIKQGVATSAAQPVLSRVPSAATGGISSARQAIAMRSTNDQEEFAGNTTSRGSVSIGRNGEPVSKGRPTDLLTELAAMPFADRASRAESIATNPVAPLDRIVQSDRIERFDAVERMRSVINHELAVLKASGADALAVVIRPTTDTEVFVQLTREKGGVEAFIRVEKGDLAELRRHWNQLEGSLAEQQVRLQPLQSGSSMSQDSEPQSRQGRFAQQPEDNGQAGAKFSFDGQSRGGFRQDDPRRPQSPFDAETFSPRIPNPSTPRSAPRRGTSADRNFDNWA